MPCDVVDDLDHCMTRKLGESLADHKYIRHEARPPDTRRVCSLLARTLCRASSRHGIAVGILHARDAGDGGLDRRRGWRRKLVRADVDRVTCVLTDRGIFVREILLQLFACLVVDLLDFGLRALCHAGSPPTCHRAPRSSSR